MQKKSLLFSLIVFLTIVQSQVKKDYLSDLKSSDMQIVRKTLEKLSWKRKLDSALVPRIMKLLDHKEPSIRRAAIFSLRRISNQSPAFASIVLKLAKALHTETTKNQSAIGRVFNSYGYRKISLDQKNTKKIVTILRKHLDNGKIRSSLLYFISKLNVPISIVPDLQKLLKQNIKDWSRRLLLNILGNMGKKAALAADNIVDDIVANAYHSSESVRISCYSALDKIQSKKENVIKACKDGLKDKSFKIRNAATMTYTQLDYKKVPKKFIEQAFYSRDGQVKSKAVYFMGKIKSKNLETLGPRLAKFALDQREYWYLRENSAIVLGTFSEKNRLLFIRKLTEIPLPKTLSEKEVGHYSDYVYLALLAKCHQIAEKIALHTIPLAKKPSLAKRYMLYNVACINSLRSQKYPEKSKEKQVCIAKALNYLSKSIDAGFRDGQHIAQDKDLIALYKLPEFKKLVDKLKSSGE